MVSVNKQSLDDVLYGFSEFIKKNLVKSKIIGLAESIVEYHKVKDPKKRKEIAKSISENYPEIVIGFIWSTRRIHLSDQDIVKILEKYFKLKYFPNENIQIVCTEEENKIYNNLKRAINAIFLKNQYKKDRYEKQKTIKIDCALKIFEIYDMYNRIFNTITNYIREKIEEEYKKVGISPRSFFLWDFEEIYKRIEMVLEEAASYFSQLK